MCGVSKVQRFQNEGVCGALTGVCIIIACPILSPHIPSKRRIRILDTHAPFTFLSPRFVVVSFFGSCGVAIAPAAGQPIGAPRVAGGGELRHQG